MADTMDNTCSKPPFYQLGRRRRLLLRQARLEVGVLIDGFHQFLGRRFCRIVLGPSPMLFMIGFGPYNAPYFHERGTDRRGA